MADKKTITEKESSKKIKDLKIELLKNPTKKASIKKEIARLLTMVSAENRKLKIENSKTRKVKTKLKEESK